jgi:hypothetical protein
MYHAGLEGATDHRGRAQAVARIRRLAQRPHAETPELAFTPKVKLEGARGGSSGGCG